MRIPTLTRKEDAPPVPAHELMTLRDYFAAKALAGLLAGDVDDNLYPKDAASAAYRYADAMLAERAQ